MADGAFEAGAAPPVPAGKSKVFVSYSRDDLEFADQLVAGLDLCGFAPIIDRHGISGGEAWQQRLGALILEADTVVFVLSPASARSEICAWEVEEAAHLGKRILPVVPRPLDGAPPPRRLQDLNYVFFYNEPRSPGSGFGSGLARLVAALNTDLGWIREHTRLLERATEWNGGGRPVSRLLSGSDIAAAKAWAARWPKGAPEPTAVQLDFIRASEDEEAGRANVERKRLADMAAAQEERAKALQSAEAALHKAAEAQRAQARARQIITWGSMAASIVLAGVAGLAALQWREAVTQQAAAGVARTAAEKQEGLARGNLYESQIIRARLLAEKAKEQIAAGDHVTAVLLTIEALDVDLSVSQRDAMFWIPDANRLLRMQSARMALKGHNASINSIAVSKDGRLVVTGADDDSLRVWDARTGAPIRQRNRPVAYYAGQTVEGVAITPDGSRILIWVGDGTARVWNPESRELIPLRTASDDKRFVRSMAMLPDGKRGVTGYNDGLVQVWELDKGRPVQALTGHTRDVRRIAVAADGSRILTTGQDKTLRLWDAATGAELMRFDEKSEDIVAIALTPDSGRIVVADRTGMIRILDPATKAEVLSFRGHREITHVAVTPDGSRILTSSRRGRVEMWDARTGAGPTEIGAHFGSVASLAITPDGARLIAGTDKVAWVWDLPPAGAPAGEQPDLLAQAKRDVPRCLDTNERLRFILSPEPPDWCKLHPPKPEAATPAAMAQAYGDFADGALYNGDFPNALKAAELGLKLDPKQRWIEVNRAHALMFLGRTAEARALHLKYRGTPLGLPSDDMLWELATLQDFEKLRQRGLEVSLMAEITGLFQPPVTAAAK